MKLIKGTYNNLSLNYREYNPTYNITKDANYQDVYSVLYAELEWLQ